MHRKRFQRFEDGRVRFLTFSTYKRLPLFNNDAIKDHFANALERARERDEFKLFAWVVMPEHVHIVLWPKERSGSVVLRAMKSSFARSVLRRWRELDAPVLSKLVDAHGTTRFWQHGGGYDRNIRDTDELREKVRYVNNNPVRRGLVTHDTDWLWSSARWYAGERESVIEIDRVPV